LNEEQLNEDYKAKLNELERIAELEIKVSKLWGMLVSYTPKGNEKLSKHGKAFGSILLQK